MKGVILMNEEFTIKNDEVKKLIDGINEAWENIDPFTQDELYMMDGRSVAEYLCKVDDLLDFLSDKCHLDDQNEDDNGNEQGSTFETRFKDEDANENFMNSVMKATARRLPEGGSISHYIPRRSTGRYPWGKE